MLVAYGTGIIRMLNKSMSNPIKFKISGRALELGLEGLRNNVEIRTLLVPRQMPVKLAAFVTRARLTEMLSEDLRKAGLPLRIFTETPELAGLEQDLKAHLPALIVGYGLYKLRNYN